jgi:hypothetical protein
VSEIGGVSRWSIGGGIAGDLDPRVKPEDDDREGSGRTDSRGGRVELPNIGLRRRQRNRSIRGGNGSASLAALSVYLRHYRSANAHHQRNPTSNKETRAPQLRVTSTRSSTVTTSMLEINCGSNSRVIYVADTKGTAG